MTYDFSLPMISMRWSYVWKRHFRVWWKTLGPSVLANFGEPMLYLIALGYGLGGMVGQVQGLEYMAFLASGIVCSSAMNTATFEGLYSAFTRMAMQHTWDGMLVAPMTVDDVVLGEIMWAATKSLLSCAAIFVVAAGLGAVHIGAIFGVLPVVFLIGLCFGAWALVITSYASGYDFFLYYFTLVVTPLMLVSGVFFPLSASPEWVQWGAMIFPLVHAVDLARPLMTGGEVSGVAGHVAVMLAYTGVALYLSIVLLRRRLLV